MRIPQKRLDDFAEWIELELYLSARDCADLRLGTLAEVYKRLFGKEPDLKDIERRRGEHAPRAK